MTSSASFRVATSVSGSSRHDVRDYALAHLGKSFFWVAGDTLTIFVLIRHGGFAPSAAGWLFLVAFSWNAACDVAVGYWADRRAVAGRTLTPVVMAAVPAMGVACAASLFMPSRYWGWTVLATLTFRTAFSVFDVPHNAMMSRLSLTPAIGLRIANLRNITSGAAAVVVGLVAVPLLDRQGETVALPLMLVLSLASLGLMVPFLLRLPRLERLPTRAVSSASDTVYPRASELSLMRLCIATAFATLALAALTKAILQLDVARNLWASSALLALSAGRVVAIGGAGSLIAALGNVGTLRGAFLALTLLILALPFAMTLGDTAPLAVILLIGLANGTQIIASWLILSGLVRSSTQEAERGSSRFGIFTMISKVATGAGGLLLGLMLSRVHSTQIGGFSPVEAVIDPVTLWSLCVCAAMGTALGAVWAKP
jgi:Na+/melibiose symporter-like transporter